MNTKPPMQTTPADAPGGDPSMEDILASIRRILSEDEAQPAALPKPPADAAPAPIGPAPIGPAPIGPAPIGQVPAIPQPPAALPDLPRGARGAGKPDVLVLDSSMMVQEPAVTPPDPTPAPTPTPPPVPPSAPQGSAVRSLPAGDGPKGAGPVETPRPVETPQSVGVPARVPSQSVGSAPSAGPMKPLGPEPGLQLVAPEAAAAASAAVGTLMRTLAAERGAAVSRSGPTIEDLVRDELRPMLKAWLDTHLPPLVERLVRAEIERVVGRTTL